MGRGGTGLEQAWLALKGLAVGAKRVLELNRREGVDALLVSSDKWVIIPLFWLVARLRGAIYLCEQSEEPFYQAERSAAWRVISAVLTHTLYRLYDGAIVISVHLDRHMTLVKAFAQICVEFPGLRLVLIGDSPRVSQIPRIRAFVEELGVVDRVVFVGIVVRGELPEYLDSATALALARPSSRQASAGFPTKVGEYLATGRPVVVTRTGEIDTYLEDGVNVYFAAPDDASAFADRLRYVLQHPEEAARVGRRGREAACEVFDFRANGLRIREFIEQSCAERARAPVA